MGVDLRELVSALGELAGTDGMFPRGASSATAWTFGPFRTAVGQWFRVGVAASVRVPGAKPTPRY